jgi:hypothetical protein
MRLRRPSAWVAVVIAVCAIAAGGAIAALLVTRGGDTTTTAAAPAAAAVETTGSAPTAGDFAPITVTRPKLPVIGGGIPVDIDPIMSRTDFNTTLFPVGPDRYRMTIFNTSSLGAINSLQWYPPVGTRIVKVLGSSTGRCVLTGLSGFGGNQFPTLVLYPNIFCDRLDLEPATCICRGDGGSVTITFTTNRHLQVNDGDLRLRTATVAFERIPLTPQELSRPPVRHVLRITPPRAASGGGLTAGERADAQRALDGLQDSNISLQLAAITTKWAQNPPATCRIGLVSRNPSRFKVYVFWVPWLAAEPYIWLNMDLADEPGTFTLGTTQPVLPGGRLTKNGRSVNRLSVDTTLLSRYGQEQEQKGREIMSAHGGDALTKPGAACEVLKNGSLELVPS